MKSLQKFRLVCGAAVVSLAVASPAAAHHVVWLDFSLWNLGAFPTVNGHTPATQADTLAVRELIIANMAKDYAAFDIYFTTVQPPRGRYTWVIFFPAGHENFLGCAGGDCCKVGNCSGIGSWNAGISAVEVYTGGFGDEDEFSGANATTARIARTISDTASHELGHVLGLSHCHAAADFVSSGTTCEGAYDATADGNVNWHIMASGDSTDLTMEERATRSRFFNAYSERRVLYAALQPRNHWAPIGDADGDSDGDLAYGRLQSPSTVPFRVPLSDGVSLGPEVTWVIDAGERADLFYMADVTGDGQADLVSARIVDAATVRWYVRASQGNGFGAATTWTTDAGDPGDIFRLGDVNGDGRVDLVFGRPMDATTVKWHVRLSSGSGFDPSTVWSEDAGAEGSHFLLGDVTGDGSADLVVASRSLTGWYPRVYRSNGDRFFLRTQAHADSFSGTVDYLLLGDVDADGRADLMTGKVYSDTDVDWHVAKSLGCTVGWNANTVPGTETEDCFDIARKWSDGTGDAGDLFRLADVDGDGRGDLIFARPRGLTSLVNAPDPTSIRWYYRTSSGTAFHAIATLATDATDDGDIVP
jgi:hypothetical protein